MAWIKISHLLIFPWVLPRTLALDTTLIEKITNTLKGYTQKYETQTQRLIYLSERTISPLYYYQWQIIQDSIWELSNTPTIYENIHESHIGSLLNLGMFK